jgi:hypothetical protein
MSWRRTSTLCRYADNVIAQQLSQISGVAQVVIGEERKIGQWVQVDPTKLVTTGQTLCVSPRSPCSQEDFRLPVSAPMLGGQRSAQENPDRPLQEY